MFNDLSNMPDLNSRERASKYNVGKPKESSDEQKGKELADKSEALAQGIENVVEGTDFAEVIDGKIGETISEDKKKSTSGQAKANKQEPAATLPRYNQELPTLEVMAIQVRTQLRKDLATLQEQANKYKKGSAFNPYHLSQIMAKIRRLREILAEIVNASAEKIKTWWKEYVKGPSS
jgi:hypothetical protein